MGTGKKKKKIKRSNGSIGKLILNLFSVIIILPLILEIFPNNVGKDRLYSLSLVDDLFSEQQNKCDYVEFFDVGQGDCTLIKSEDSAVLIDFGLESDDNRLYDNLLKRGIKTIDLAIVTHHHNDHLGGFYDLAEKMKIESLVINSDSAEDGEVELFQKTIQLANKKGIELFLPISGSCFSFGNATLKFLDCNHTATDENNRSVIMMVEICGTKLLFTGDSDTVTEQDLLQKYNVKCDILKMGHHGSAGSSCTEFLKSVSPEFAVASCGYDNLYNHPADSAVQRAKDQGIKVLRTDLDRNIKVTFNQNKDYTITTERGAVYDSVR